MAPAVSIGSQRGAQRADLDRHVRPRDAAQVVLLQPQLRRPAGHRLGQVLDQVQVLGLVRVGLGVAHARLAQQVHAEGDARVPQLREPRQGAAGIGPGDELARHPLDLPGDGLGHQALGQGPGPQAEVHARRQRHVRLGQVVHQVLVHHLAAGQHREGVHEPEQLDLEPPVAHGPVHQLVAVEALAQQPGPVPTRPLEHLPTDGLDARVQRVGLDRRQDPAGRGPRRRRRHAHRPRRPRRSVGRSGRGSRTGRSWTLGLTAEDGHGASCSRASGVSAAGANGHEPRRRAMGRIARILPVPAGPPSRPTPARRQARPRRPAAGCRGV
ncbi:MAG: hypothetical protein KatS3mg103_0722 [Phycisphaerales bacterium]|nr:MAG: hypothetical protein KatS3mg103_0722 [Phycisphaerales bacterium]